ncbi:MAG: insulinase family protein [Anaerolineae bacterium]|nr:insulinase family protein [Anaerolineae bacterium]
MTTHPEFELIEERTIPELNTHAALYRHRATGAELLSLENDDENKVFGITFRTPPPDSTGLPHIMEHSVLCGSRKYPVKEPFIELAKGSLNTFLNAFTYSDKTCYPVASQNLQDFYNLVDVYLDAVFYPRIGPEVLQQEGWHYELESLDAPLTYKGVVFNEMKGAYSSPDNLVAQYSEESLFPGHVYSHDAGGDPEVIPNLTYAQFKSFHEMYYHPSNARLFFYGDDDPAKRLQLAQGYLKDFAARPVNSAIPLQPALATPRHITHFYPVSEDSEDAKSYVSVNWLLPENNDPALALALEILSHVLAGTPASPLRKTLIDSGLGEDVIGGGTNDSLRQLTFSTGMKGVKGENVEKVITLILDTLAKLARNGLAQDIIAASLNTLEFQLREQNFGYYPRGLVVMLRALTSWLHDGDPFAPIAFEAPLNAVKERLAANPRFLEGLIQTYLLDNTHRTVVVLAPDAGLQQKQEAAEKARLEQARAAMDDETLQTVLADAQRLKALQEAPNSPEALATIPRLKLTDLDKKVKLIPTDVAESHGARLLHHNLFTNGILYLDLGLDLHTLPQELLPYAQMFGEALLNIGTETEDFVKMTLRIGQKTGGIGTVTTHMMLRDGDHATSWLFLRGKATVAQSADLLAILRDILLTVKLDNPSRFMQMLLENKAGVEAAVTPAGHRMAASRLRSRFNEAAWAAEQMGGVSYLFFLRDLIAQAEKDWPTVLARLEEVRRLLVNRATMICNVTLDAENWANVRPQVDTFLAALPSSPAAPAAWAPAYQRAPEGLTIPAKINYVAKGANLFDLGYIRHGSMDVITNCLRSTWLWDKVRVQGGAYGVYSMFDPHSGLFTYLSYRDPNLLDTLAAYDGAVAFLRDLDLPEEELVKNIIGAIGALDAYQLPDAKGYSALMRHLIGYSDEARQQHRDEVLSTTLTDFRRLADVLEKLNATGSVVVLGTQEVIEKAGAEGNIPFAITKVL